MSDNILMNLDVVPKIRASAPLKDDDKLFLTVFDEDNIIPPGRILETMPDSGTHLYVGTDIKLKNGASIKVVESGPNRMQLLVSDKNGNVFLSRETGATDTNTSGETIDSFFIIYTSPIQGNVIYIERVIYYGDIVQAPNYDKSLGQLTYTNLFGNDNDVITYTDVTEGELSSSFGGNGERDMTSDYIEIPVIPTMTSTNTGFMNIVKNPSFENLKNMLFPDIISFDSLLFSIYGKPSDYIISLIMLPFDVSAGGPSGNYLGPFANESYSIGGSKVVKQFQKIDLGSVRVDEFFASALDYAPSTEISIYLPFVGTHQLDTDEVMGRDIRVIYHVDVMTGTFVCYLEVAGLGVIYNFSGNMATSIPLTSVDYSNTMSALLQLGVSNAIDISTGNNVGAISTTLSALNNMKPTITKKSNMSSSAGIMGVLTPFIIKKIPKQCMATNYGKLVGFPSNLSSKLKNIKGYTEVDSIHLTNVKATTEEKNEIINILKGGVII